MKQLDAYLKDVVSDLSAELPEVTVKRMFGSEAFFANENIYALIWDGRIVLRFSDEPRRVKAEALKGSSPWDPMRRDSGFSRWVCMPEAMHDDVEALGPWVEEAHREAMALPPKKKKPAAKKKTAKKR